MKIPRNPKRERKKEMLNQPRKQQQLLNDYLNIYDEKNID